jgi:putative polyketide hydroxylase
MEVPVLIVGGGPTGLATSIMLSRFGIRSVLVERHPGTSIHPKVTGITTRTMELFREWGIEEQVRAVALDVEPTNSVCFSLASPEIERRSLGFPDPVTARSVSPTTPVACPQDYFEPILLDRARSFPDADIRFGTELVHLRQDDTGVDAALYDRINGRTTVVRARYVVAGDGVSSPIRKQLRIPFFGVERITDYLSILFRARLDPFIDSRRCGLYSIQNPSAPGVMVPTSRDGRWVFATPWQPAEHPLETVGADRQRELIRLAAGVPELEIDLMSAQMIRIAALVAERFRDGHIFLAGDAAHRMAPTGAMGMNTSIHDAHNLAWKLAAVLHGWAGSALLDSYETERKPVAELNVVRSIGQRKEASGLAVDLGIRYESSAVLTDEQAIGAAVAEPTTAAEPGRRIPHFWLGRNSRSVSTLDLCDTRMLLIAGPDGEAWRRAAEHAARELSMPIDTCVVGAVGNMADPSYVWRTSFGIETDRAVLVRPDGHIAWNAPAATNDTVAAIKSALNRTLSRDGTQRKELFPTVSHEAYSAARRSGRKIA